MGALHLLRMLLPVNPTFKFTNPGLPKCSEAQAAALTQKLDFSIKNCHKARLVSLNLHHLKRLCL